MSLLFFPLSCILLFLAISGYAHASEEPKLSEFAQKVLDDLTSSVFDKLFNVNFKDQEEYFNVVEKGIEALQKVYGKQPPVSYRQQLGELLGNANVQTTPKILFAIFGNGVSKTLMDNGMLTKENTDKLAEKFASFLKQTAEHHQIAKFSETEPDLEITVAKFLKSLGMTSEKDADNVLKNLFDAAEEQLIQ